MNYKMQIIKHFGPSILKVRIPDDILNNLNNYIDEIIKNKTKTKSLDHGDKLVGDVTQEFKLESDFITKIGWLNFLGICTSKWIEADMGKKIKNFKIISSWIVRQFKDEYNPVHWHGGHISGAGFLKLPETFGKHVQNKNNSQYQGGKLQLIHGSRMFLSNSKFTINPEVGDFYFFPNYMMHTVYPFKYSNQERRSISFNAKIDEDIYDVYSA